MSRFGRRRGKRGGGGALIAAIEMSGDIPITRDGLNATDGPLYPAADYPGVFIKPRTKEAWNLTAAAGTEWSGSTRAVDLALDQQVMTYTMSINTTNVTPIAAETVGQSFSNVKLEGMQMSVNAALFEVEKDNVSVTKVGKATYQLLFIRATEGNFALAGNYRWPILQVVFPSDILPPSGRFMAYSYAAERQLLHMDQAFLSPVPSGNSTWKFASHYHTSSRIYNANDRLFLRVAINVAWAMLWSYSSKYYIKSRK